MAKAGETIWIWAQNSEDGEPRFEIYTSKEKLLKDLQEATDTEEYSEVPEISKTLPTESMMQEWDPDQIYLFEAKLIQPKKKEVVLKYDL
jgi:hypothetical protein